MSKSALVIGAQGVLGGLLVDAFAGAGWEVLRGGRRKDDDAVVHHVDLDEPETLAAVLGAADVVVNAVPHAPLTAERMVLARGGILVNVSAMPEEAGLRLRGEVDGARGTVLMNAGIAPGLTNLVAADLLATHPDADEVELVFTVPTNGGTGRAGREFAHRGFSSRLRHRVAEVPLPDPFGRRRCLGFAEDDHGWLGTLRGPRAVSPYVCIAEAPIHAALLVANRTRLLSRMPLSAYVNAPAGESDGREPVAHWVAVRRGGRRLAARTVECRGDYRAAAASTEVAARALLDAFRTDDLPAGVHDPHELLSIEGLADELGAAGIVVRDRIVADRRAA